MYNSLLAAGPGQITETQRGQPLAYRWRCIECGPRELETQASTRRWAIMADGPLGGGWEYRAGLIQASSEAKSRLGTGYYYRGTTATGASDGGAGIIPAPTRGRTHPLPPPGLTPNAQGT